MSALSVAFLAGGAAILSVILGVAGAYCAMSGILAVVNPSRPSHTLAAEDLPARLRAVPFLGPL